MATEKLRQFLTPEELKLIDRFVPEWVEYSNLESMVEFERAGKNLANFSRRLSKQERRPVLVLNNPRTGAFLQLGFRHWLANFKSEDQAKKFLAELENDPGYAQMMAELHEKTEQIKAALKPRKTEFNKSESDAISSEIDPTADIRLDLSLWHYFNFQSKEEVQKFGDLLWEVYRIKDKIRASIFHQAKKWIDAGEIDSFVYPINHWKVSGHGLERYEFEHDGATKLNETIALPETLVVSADVHKSYGVRGRRKGLGMDEGGELSNRLQNYRDHHPEAIDTDPFVRLLAGAKSVRASLEYPLSPNAQGKLHSVQKNPLNKAKFSGAKIIDVQVLFPSQAIGGSHPDATYPYTGLTESRSEPFRVMKMNEERPDIRNQNLALRKASEALRGNPDWIKKFKPQIMLEPNYTFAGPEL